MSANPVNSEGTVADAPRGNWVDRYAPARFKPFLRMGRLDRPIGYELLFWPCAYSLGLAAVATNTAYNFWYFLLFLLGAVVMRGAGCTFNDIVDRNIDGKVARTRSRPIPSGQVTVRQAIFWMLALCGVGLVVLLQFNTATIALAIASLGLAAIYPFMKRITYWPQLFLGFAFSWGAFVGWSSITGGLGAPAVLMYMGCILWIIGYDTIYALQDVEDDALIGVKSTARLIGSSARPFVALFYLGAMALWVAAGFAAESGAIFAIFALVPAGLLAWQVLTLRLDDGANCLKRFKSNHWVGVALTAAFVLETLL